MVSFKSECACACCMVKPEWTSAGSNAESSLEPVSIIGFRRPPRTCRPLFALHAGLSPPRPCQLGFMVLRRRILPSRRVLIRHHFGGFFVVSRLLLFSSHFHEYLFFPRSKRPFVTRSPQSEALVTVAAISTSVFTCHNWILHRRRRGDYICE